MSIGLIGRKVGMTQLFADDGTMVPVSVLEITPNTVTRLRTSDRDGYTAVQLGAGQGRRLTKPVAGQLKGLPQVAAMREFRVESVDGVDVTGVSKGGGFAGTVKRHHFKRGPKTHGSDNYRKPGSIGPGTTPGRVYRGLRMAGHKGSQKTTIRKLQVVRADAERNLLLVRGSVPGSRGALVLVRKA
jgi:large subunit ribosomal protein L3